MTYVDVVDRRDAQWWRCGSHNSLQRLNHASNLIHNFKVAPYHIAKVISPDTSKGHTSFDISRSKRPKPLTWLIWLAWDMEKEKKNEKSQEMEQS